MRTWIEEMLTATRSPSQARASVQARLRAQRPISTMNPVASATGDDLARRDPALAGLVPAQQRLEAGDAAAPHVDERLVVQLHLLGSERRPHVDVELAVALDLLLQRRVEGAPATLAVRLGAVEGEIGAHEEARRLDGVVGHVGDADADADLQQSLVDPEGPAQVGHGPGGQRLRLGPSHVAGDHRELVAAEAEDAVRAADGEQARRDLLQQPVADEVAAGVVDGLEAVEVEIEQGAAALGRAHLAAHDLQRLLEVGPVGQPGQGVVAGEEGDSGLRRPACGHVGADAPVADEGALTVEGGLAV